MGDIITLPGQEKIMQFSIGIKNQKVYLQGEGTEDIAPFYTVLEPQQARLLKGIGVNNYVDRKTQGNT